MRNTSPRNLISHLSVVTENINDILLFKFCSTRLSLLDGEMAVSPQRVWLCVLDKAFGYELIWPLTSRAAVCWGLVVHLTGHSTVSSMCWGHQEGIRVSVSKVFLDHYGGRQIYRQVTDIRGSTVVRAGTKPMRLLWSSRDPLGPCRYRHRWSD